MKTILIALLLANTTSLTSTQKAELQRVEERLLAPCCYRQSIAVHRSGIAKEMRMEVAQMVAAGRTEEEIIERYKGVYGERILILPDGTPGKILFALPVVTSLLASLALFVNVRKMLRAGKKRLSIAEDQPPHAINKPLREKMKREIGELF